MKTLLIFLFSAILACNPGDESSAPASPTNYVLILNKSADTAWQLDAETGERLAEYPTGDAPHEVAISPDQNRAVITNYGGDSPGNSLTIVDLERQAVSKTISLGNYRRPHGVQWFSDGKRAIVTAESRKAVLVVDIDAGEILSSIDTGQDVSHMVVLSADEKTAYVTNLGSGSLSILDLESGETAQTISTGAGTEGVTIIPGKNEVWITNRQANTVSILDAATVEITGTLESSSFPIRAEVSPDERLVAVSNAESSEVSVFEVDSRKQIQAFSTISGNQPGMPIGLTFSRDGARLFVANSTLNHIAVFDTQTWKLITTFKTDETPDGIAYISAKNNH